MRREQQQSEVKYRSDQRARSYGQERKTNNRCTSNTKSRISYQPKPEHHRWLNAKETVLNRIEDMV